MSKRPRVQTTEVLDYDAKPPRYVKVTLPPRPNGHKHLTECLLFDAPEMYCTCDDDSPEWTL